MAIGAIASLGGLLVGGGGDGCPLINGGDCRQARRADAEARKLQAEAGLLYMQQREQKGVDPKLIAATLMFLLLLFIVIRKLK